MSVADPTPQPAQPMGGSTVFVTYEPKPGLWSLGFKNFFLNIITLGIYRFWAKTDIRKHVWSCVKINGEPLEYTGRGIELFLGALIVFFVIFLPFILITNGLQLAGYVGAAAAFNLLFLLLFFMLWGMAIYRAMRYRLSRTVWRGVRGGLVGSPFQYSLLYFGTSLLSGITMGWSNPAMNLELRERMTTEMRFGDTPFNFKGRAGPLYGRYAACWFGSIFAWVAVIAVIAIVFSSTGFGDNLKRSFEELGRHSSASQAESVVFVLIAVYGGLALFAIVFGVIWSFYTAKELAVFASYTTFDNAAFKLNATAFSLIGLWLGNLLLIIFTLGIATPLTVQRTFKYIVDRLEVHGWIDMTRIVQSSQTPDKVGEGLLDAFDIDGI